MNRYKVFDLRPRTRILRTLLAGVGLPFVCTGLHAQLGMGAVVDLALRHSPRVKTAEADVQRARAALAENKDAYVPALTAGAALGQGYGYSPSPPTLFTVTSQSLVYNASQTHYTQAARAALQAASFTLGDVSESVAEDASLAFASLDHDQQRDRAFDQESEYSTAFVRIAEERFQAGVDTRQELTNARLAAAQLKSRKLHAQTETANDREHLARLLGLPSASVVLAGGFPTAALPQQSDSTLGGPANLSVAAAFANAAAKRQTAYGDTHFLYRPQLALAAQYNRYATFTDSFKQLQDITKTSAHPNGTIGADESAFGVQITLPLLDKARQARGRESLADAAHAFHEAENAQNIVLDAQTRLHHTIEELEADADVARLLQEQAQEQLEVIRVQLAASSSGTGPAMTPKDEQNAHLTERDRYISLLDTTFSLRQAEIQYLRQTGQLEAWLRSPSRTSSTSFSSTP
ncbi:MAG: TolC family protein [Janthinobacterium lividum]